MTFDLPPLPPEDELEQEAVSDAFAQRLRQIRERHGWTQAQVAAWSGISGAQISRYECGLETPRVANLLALCRGLRCSADYLIGLPAAPEKGDTDERD